MCSHGKVLIPLQIENLFPQFALHLPKMQVYQPGLPCQVYKGWWCTAAVKWEFSARRWCTDAQIFLSIHQEKGNYDVEAGDPLRYSTSSLILVRAHCSRYPSTSTVDITSHIAGSAAGQSIAVAHFLYIRGAEPIKQLHVPRAAAKRCQTGNGNQISTISTLRNMPLFSHRGHLSSRL